MRNIFFVVRIFFKYNQFLITTRDFSDLFKLIDKFNNAEVFDKRDFLKYLEYNFFY